MYRHALMFLATTLVVTACSDRDPVSPLSSTSARPALPSARASVSWASQLTGETGPGSTYALHVPSNWNGKLVVYAHGFVDAALPVALPSIDALRDAIGEQGYAIAYSSFSENGYDFKDGLQRTHQLRGLFASKYGQPTQTLAMGSSLGGLITLALAEKYPQQYSGALPMCGVVGGTRREVQYIGDVRALFDFYYPNVLPGGVSAMPTITDLNAQIVGPALAAIMANQAPVGIIANVAQTPIPGVSGAEFVNSLLTAVGFHARGLADLTDRAQGRVPYGNTTVTYSSAPFNALMPALNAGVERVTLAPNALQWLEHNYEPSGNIEIPVLTIHGSRDPVVPIFHEGILATAVANAGRSANLLQRTVNGYGHCGFSTAQMVGALNDLASWVDSGIKPAN